MEPVIYINLKSSVILLMYIVAVYTVDVTCKRNRFVQKRLKKINVYGIFI